jgi:hypothetical protein
MRDFISKYTVGIILVIFGLLGTAVIWISSPWGIGVGYDSIFYLSASDNILSGSGLSRFDGYGNTIPLTHFPPLYSLTLAGFSLITGFESDLAARILAAVLFGFLVGLSGWLVYRHTRSLLASVLGSTFVLVSPVLLEVSFMAMSELLYLVLLLLMIDFFNKYLLDGNLSELIIASVFAALMYLTRYVGLTAVALGAVSLLVFQPRTWGKKVKDVIIFVVISLVPMLILYARNWYLTGSMTNRIISFHPPTINQIMQGISTVSTWLLPGRIDPTIRLVVLGIFLIAIVTLIVLSYYGDKQVQEDKTYERGARQFVLLLVLYAIIYLVMVIFSLTFFDASTKLNDRILSPVYLAGILAGLITIWNSSWFEESVFVRYGVVAICLVFIGINFLRGYDVLNSMRKDGRGFSGKEWNSSETVAALAKLPPDTLLFSNEAFAIYYLAGIPANWIPENYDPVKDQEDENYFQRIGLMRDEIISHNGALVIFNSISKHNVYASIDELSRGLSLFRKAEDGAIFTSP